jgi:hypothetical protein
MANFDDLSLYEQTQKVQALKQHFTSIGRPNISMDDVLALSKAGYDSGSSDLQMFQAGLVDIQTLVNAKQSKSTEPKPTSLEGSLTQACQQLAEQNRRDEYKKQLALHDYNNPPTPAEPEPNYPNYY